ncbi:hypothetical protein FQN50_002646 [Emmonsiellopsis sp. PD_5]|nr:hypothetical protein FQN50_002646 [Emmonsiellopsis sp. PD_5]
MALQSDPDMSAFGHQTPDTKTNSRIVAWLDNQDEPGYKSDRHLKTTAEIVMRIQGANGDDDEYVHLRAPKSNLDINFDSSTGGITIKEVTTMTTTQSQHHKGTVVAANPSNNRLAPSTKPPPSLTVILRLSQANCDLVKLEELKDTSLLLTVRINDGQRLTTETHQHGFISGTLLSPLENALQQSRTISSMQILLPASQIPWKWTAATVLATFGKMTVRERRNMALIYKRVVECQYQIREYNRLIPGGKGLGELRGEEEFVGDRLENLDVSERREWLGRYERIVDEEAVIKARDQWVREAERLKREHNALLEVIGNYTSAAVGFEGVVNGGEENEKGLREK